MRQILWGLFKKVVIADNCAEYANLIFNNYQDYNGSTLLLGAIFFTFQIYGDFSGYSDIAIGTSRLFGFNLMQNFATPYFSRDIAEFWRRWHISLSTWFRDYLYIPLGGSRGGTWMKVRNTFIIFLVSGFWHGANWTFIVWGGLNALYFLPLLLLKRNRTNLGVVAEGRMLPNLRELWQMGTTFLLTVLAWVFFRAENIKMALNYIYGIVSVKEGYNFINVIDKGYQKIIFIELGLAFSLFLFLEWTVFRDKGKNLTFAQIVTLILLILFMSGRSGQFIYFQF